MGPLEELDAGRWAWEESLNTPNDTFCKLSVSLNAPKSMSSPQLDWSATSNPPKSAKSSFAARSSFVVTGFWSLNSPPPEPISASLKAIYMSANLLVALLFHGRLGILTTPPWEDWREWLGSLNFSRASFSELSELKLVELSLVVADGPGLCWKSPKSSVSVKWINTSKFRCLGLGLPFSSNLEISKSLACRLCELLLFGIRDWGSIQTARVRFFSTLAITKIILLGPFGNWERMKTRSGFANREIFNRRVPGFPKTTRTYPKFSEDFRRRPKMSKQF